MDSYESLGDCLYVKEEYQQAILMYEQSLKGISEGKQSMWTRISMARGYANLGNKPMADKSFSLLKRKSGDEFWSRVADYYVADKDWAGKYGAYIGDWRIEGIKELKKMNIERPTSNVECEKMKKQRN